MTDVAPAGNPIRDARSGLFSEAFLQAVLPTRIATARRILKQLGLVVVEVGPNASGPFDRVKVANLVARTLRDSDTAVGLDNGCFALLLEFTPVEGCVIVAERMQTILDREFPDLSSWAGVACYPAHAIDETELLTAATNALAEAKTADPAAVAVAPVAD
ncbi:MAG: hypothetical protein WKF43_09710 [Acidimicrobiales bacterium]